MSQVRSGALIASIVFAVFAAYAFLSPATYRTSALLVVDQPSPAGSGNLPEPLEAARRLSEAILDRKTLQRLSRERAGSPAPEAQAQASSSVRRGLEIDTSDARNFSISYRDTDPARTQRACNTLAKHAVELAPLILVDRSAERAQELTRQEQTQELAAFLALHPQVAAEPPPAGDKPADNDAALAALNAEKSNLEHRIVELETDLGSDNPYVDPRESDPKLLRRRLAEINNALSARRQALDAKQTGPQLPPEVRAEWKRLLDGVALASSDAQAQVRPALLARLASQAALPSSPIEPNRRLLLFFGVVFGSGTGAAFALAMRAAQQRRAKSTRPPALVMPSQGALTVQLPLAPALPSGLGPAVPEVPRLTPSPAAAIVPIPQRLISSSPPELARNNGHHSASNPPQAVGSTQPAEVRNSTTSRPARRFASTLVLPPSDNPSPNEEATLNPVLASAAQAWDQQIRAHEVPGFAVVQSSSEPPAALAASVEPSSNSHSVSASSSNPPPAATRSSTRSPNQMKVTQPLGSFLPDSIWKDSIKESIHKAQAVSRSPVPARSSSPAPAPVSQYSYVSSNPPPASSPPKNVVLVQEVPKTWHPDPSLTPDAQRGLCEQLYPYAVESCFVLSVVAVPESVGYKSRVAAELALALAESGHPRILLLEGDLRRPWVQRMIGVDMPISTGFSQQLNGRAQGTGQTRWAVLGCTRSLHVLAEGMMRSPGLLLSEQFSNCVKELRTYYDFIVIDGPTASLDLDSGALDAVTDGVVTVCPAKGSKSIAHMQSLFARKRFSAFATAPER